MLAALESTALRLEVLSEVSLAFQQSHWAHLEELGERTVMQGILLDQLVPSHCL